MSTLGAGTGKERSGAINFWIFLLVAALIVLGVNFYAAATKNAQENKARDRIADIQVLSQQIAKFAQEAASGGYEAFAELQATKDRIQLNLDVLREGSTPALIAKAGADEREQFSGIPSYQQEAGVQEPLSRLVTIWGPINQDAQN